MTDYNEEEQMHTALAEKMEQLYSAAIEAAKIAQSPVQLQEMVSSRTLAVFKAAKIELTQDQLQTLVTTIIMRALQNQVVSSPAASSFVDANFSFNGAKDYWQVQEFLSKANAYKNATKMSDEIAIKSVPILLKETAFTWWQIEKDNICTWEEFQEKLCFFFAPKKPGYMIFQEIFSNKQLENELTEMFLIKNRALLSQLPPPGLTEEQQLDVIYGQLNLQIRERVFRDSVSTFEELVEAARRAEQLICEMKEDMKKDMDSSSTETEETKTAEEKGPKGLRERAEAFTQVPSPSEPTCSGCGTVGVLRFNCPTCPKQSKLAIARNRNREFH